MAKQSASPVIDADGHVLESQLSETDWKQLLPPEFHAQAPKRVPFRTGGGRAFLDGEFWVPPYKAGHDVKGGVDLPDLHGQRPGMWESKPRLVDMDTEGIDIAVLFGGGIAMGLSGLRDPRFASAMARAYNDWLHRFCQGNPTRLKGMAGVAMQRPEDAVQEIDRAINDLGFVGIVLPPNVLGVTPDQPLYHPVYAEAQRLDVPVAYHMAANHPRVRGAGTERFDTFFMVHQLAHPFEQMIALACVVAGGMMDQFPTLRFAFLEGGCTWLPYWVDRLNEHYEVLGHQVKAKAMPGEYVKSPQCYVSCEVDESGLEWTVDYVGEDHILYASDYWHWDAKFPDSVRLLRERKTLRERVREKVLGVNAARLYRINGHT